MPRNVRTLVRTLSLVSVATVALLLAACGGGSNSAAGSSTSSSSGSSSGNSAPIISGSPATTVSSGAAYSFIPKASGSDGATLRFSISNMPAWATFNTTTGQLSGTPSAANAGRYANIVISVSDGNASASLAAFTVTVTQVGQGSVALSWTEPTLNADGSALTDLAGYYIRYGTDAAALTQSITVADATVISYTVPGLSSGTYYFSVTSYTSSGVESIASNSASAAVP